jgi:hypothetical protein
MKVSFVLSIALAIVTVVAIAIVWLVLDALGVFSSLNSTLGDISGSGTTGTTSTSSSSFISSYLSFGHVLGYTLLLALVDIVLVTAISTLAAYLYNIATRFVGGLELTLTDDH